MSHLPPIATLHELLKLLNIKACGQLSQNFLLQPWSIKGFINCAGNLTDSNVLEVGPGPGGLTRYILAEKPYRLAVVEIDRRFLFNLDELKNAAETENTIMDIYNQDILKFNCDNIFPETHKYIHQQQAWKPEDTGLNELENRKIHVIGNLPFNISTILLCRWLHDISERRGLWSYAKVPLTLSFQQQIAHRMTAEVFDSERSRLSILCQSICELKTKKIIPGSAFLPKAKVDCGVVHLIPRSTPLIPVPFPYVNKFVKAIFQFKSKSIVDGVESLFPPDLCDLTIQLFAKSGVDPSKHPIELTMEEWRVLCESYHELCLENVNVFDYEFRERRNLNAYRNRKKIQRFILGGPTLNISSVMSGIDNMKNKLNDMT